MYNILGGYNSIEASAPTGSWVVESSGVDDYMEAATLGDLTASKIRVVLERVTWNAEGYLFSQAGSLSSSRELGLYIFGGNYGIILGGLNNTNVGSAAGSPIVDVTIDVTVDYVGNTLLFLVDSVEVYNGAIFSGTSRVNNQDFRIFARGGGAYAPSGTRVGNTQVYIDDILVRDYDFDGSFHGAQSPLTVDETVSSSDLTAINMVTDGSAWVQVAALSNDIATSFNLSQLTFSAVIDNTAIENNTTTSFDLAPLGFSVVMDNPLENSIVTDFDLSKLSFSAVIDNNNQTNNTTTAFNLSPLSFSAVIDNTIVDNTVTTNFALNALQFSTQVQNGDFSPVFIASNNVMQVTYSTSIIQLTYSTNIQGK